MANSILAKTQTGEIQLTITIPAKEVKKAYDQAWEKIVKETEIQGFRKGKAPKNLVEEKIDKAKIYEQVLQKIVPQAYLEAVKEHRLEPIIPPRVELLKANEGEDWEIRAITCEAPEVNLGNYQEAIRKGPAPTELQKTPKNMEDEKTQKVIEILLETAEVSLPSILVEDELNRSLANLINQTEKLGLTIDQYLRSIGKSADQLRNEYKARIASNLKLQFILEAIAANQGLEISEKEVDDLIAVSGEEKLKQNLNSPGQREYLKGILRRRKVLDFLGKL